jgi:hypothetical protein
LAGTMERHNFLAHYTVPGREFNKAAWPKTGKIVEIFRDGELRVDNEVMQMFATGKFLEPKAVGIFERILKKFR